FRLAVDTPVTLKLAGFEGGYAKGSLLWIINNIYFQYYSLFIFLVSVIVMIVVSAMTQAPSPERIENLTYATVTAEGREESRRSWTRSDVLSSALVVVLILIAYLYFTG
ncbi:MAG TPA: hypothetical protein PLS95_14060, partial [Thermoanaerobaculales bacterium]|nr:hypothetical protein [Thermoanaerobaculales bacterium]